MKKHITFTTQIKTKRSPLRIIDSLSEHYFLKKQNIDNCIINNIAKKNVINNNGGVLNVGLFV